MQRPFLATLNWLLCLSFALPPSAVTQTSSPADTTFTSNSELVLVPVQVLDHMGQPLRGLKQQDFVLESDGKAQPIGVFDEIRRQPPVSHSGDLLRVSTTNADTASTTFSNVPSSGLPHDSVILAVDLVNTSPYLQNWIIQQIVKYLRATPLQSPTALVALTSRGMLQFQGFTTDTSALIAAAYKIGPHAGRPDFSNAPSLHVSFTGPGTYASSMAEIAGTYERSLTYAANAVFASLRCFDEIAWAYAGIPGRKTVAWFTSGFPVLEEVPNAPPLFGKPGPPSAEPSTSRRHFGKRLLPDFQNTFTALSRSNVVLYPIDVTGLPEDRPWSVWDAMLGGYPCGSPFSMNSPGSKPFFINSPGVGRFSMSSPGFGPFPMNSPRFGAWSGCQDVGGGWLDRIGLEEIASGTGGKDCTAGHNVGHCVDQANAESSDYYLLGFYVPQSKRQAGWHELNVRVNVEHGEVRAREGYLLQSGGTATAFERGQDMDRAINAAVEYTGLAFKVEPGSRPGGSDAPIVFKVSVPATSIVLMPGEEKLSFDVIAVPLSDRGTPLHDTARIVSLNIPPPRMQTALVKGWNLIDSISASNRIAAVKVLIRDNTTGKIGSVVFPVPGGATL